jgi:uncharacterized membrane-anchored protein YitT (DUF2179 family)
LAEELMNRDFRVTVVPGEGKFGPVKVLFTVAKRKRWQELSEVVNKFAPNAFYSVEDVKKVSLMEEEIQPTRLDVWSRMLKLKKSI